MEEIIKTVINMKTLKNKEHLDKSKVEDIEEVLLFVAKQMAFPDEDPKEGGGVTGYIDIILKDGTHIDYFYRSFQVVDHFNAKQVWFGTATFKEIRGLFEEDLWNILKENDAKIYWNSTGYFDYNTDDDKEFNFDEDWDT